MNARTWNLLRPPGDLVGRLESELGISNILATVLANRGVAEPPAAHAFLHPSPGMLHDPLRMRGMFEAVYAVARAVRAGERILVWGDYDVDGVTGTALLLDFLRRHTPHVGYHIPHRLDDGYGLHAGALRRFAAEGVSLVITVDCGISNAAEVLAGRELGMSFVITDHHEPPAVLPAAEAVLNPRRPGCPYPDKKLAGVGIAFKLAQALARLIGPGPQADADPGLFSYLDLVALGTVADIAPLTGENRILVKQGLEVLGRTRRPGLQALMAAAGIETRPVRASQIGFGIGPRINAAGRLERAETAVELILAEDASRAEALAGTLERLNRRRQEVEAGILAEALALVGPSPEGVADRFLVLAAPTWHAGVVGIVAAKLAERYARPAILVSTDREPGKGSARSVPDIDLFAHLARCRHLLTAFGGHPHAAGLSIRAENIPALRRELNRGDAAARPPAPAAARIDIDAVLEFGRARPVLAEELRLLAPFGHRNPQPLFLAEGVRPARAPRTVGNNHLKVTLIQKPHARDCIGFNLGEYAAVLSPELGVSVVYDLDLEGGGRFPGERLRLRDIRVPYAVPAARG